MLCHFLLQHSRQEILSVHNTCLGELIYVEARHSLPLRARSSWSAESWSRSVGPLFSANTLSSTDQIEPKDRVVLRRMASFLFPRESSIPYMHCTIVTSSNRHLRHTPKIVWGNSQKHSASSCLWPPRDCNGILIKLY